MRSSIETIHELVRPNRQRNKRISINAAPVPPQKDGEANLTDEGPGQSIRETEDPAAATMEPSMSASDLACGSIFRRRLSHARNTSVFTRLFIAEVAGIKGWGFRDQVNVSE